MVYHLFVNKWTLLQQIICRLHRINPPSSGRQNNLSSHWNVVNNPKRLSGKDRSQTNKFLRQINCQLHSPHYTPGNLSPCLPFVLKSKTTLEKYYKEVYFLTTYLSKNLLLPHFPPYKALLKKQYIFPPRCENRSWDITSNTFPTQISILTDQNLFPKGTIIWSNHRLHLAKGLKLTALTSFTPKPPKPSATKKNKKGASGYPCFKPLLILISSVRLPQTQCFTRAIHLS